MKDFRIALEDDQVAIEFLIVDINFTISIAGTNSKLQRSPWSKPSSTYVKFVILAYNSKYKFFFSGRVISFQSIASPAV